MPIPASSSLSENRIKRVKLVVAYDGTEFCGWAPQSGLRTVHGILTETVRQVSGEDCEITGASRTDSGAHAIGQVCHFDTARPISQSNWLRALNDRLPRDLAVVGCQFVNSNFHSRFWARDRLYRYRIILGKRDPHRERFAYHFGRELDLEAMSRAARLLEGRHDFRSFTQQLEETDNTERVIFGFRVRKVFDEVRIEVLGSAFARGMMRRMSGALLEVGRGKRPQSWISDLLKETIEPSITLPPVLPARGLTLLKVNYGRSPQLQQQYEK